MFKQLPSIVTIDKKDVEEMYIADYLSDMYGFCIFSLSTKVVGDKIIVSDIAWDKTE